PPPPHVIGAAQVPQFSVLPQPSEIVSQFLPWAAHVVGVQPPDQPTLSTYAVPDHPALVVNSTPNRKRGAVAFGGTVKLIAFQAPAFREDVEVQFPVQVQPPEASWST